MRQIVLDTETTGLSPDEGHRIIEIGCIELQHRRVSERRFHYYLNPEREIDRGASDVHGLTMEKLRECPRFKDIAHELIEFVRGAEVIIHNAPFDVGFVNQELAQLGSAWGRFEDYCAVIDTLKMARDLHPGQRNSLDVLCKRYEVEHGHRTLHGAMLDAELLADVYLAMTGGQGALGFDSRLDDNVASASSKSVSSSTRRGRVIAATMEEIAQHQQRLLQIDSKSDGACVWLKQEGSGAA